MLREVISFLVFTASLTVIVGWLLAILTSPPMYLPQDEAKKKDEKVTKSI